MTFKSASAFEEQLVTPCFQTVYVPYLEGTQKQIDWARKIRKMYICTLQRKLADIPMFEYKKRTELVQVFNAYINAEQTRHSRHWIENHCRECGCILARSQSGQTQCTNYACGVIHHG